jgi:hypothetical protein
MKKPILLTFMALVATVTLIATNEFYIIRSVVADYPPTTIELLDNSVEHVSEYLISLSSTQEQGSGVPDTLDSDRDEPPLDPPGADLPEADPQTESDDATDSAQSQQTQEKKEFLVAYYGHPNSRFMGIVGRHSLPELVELVTATAQSYQEILPDYRVIPAIYLIYGTVQPEGRIGFMSDAMVNRYIDYAKDHGVHIILDHQIGRYTLQQTMDRLLPYLVHPHVHLAVDFEWRTERPMQEIGFVRGEELTWMQQYMSDFLVRNNLPNTRFLIFHQFKSHMVRNHPAILVGFPQVELVHSTSGWGSPEEKRSTHAYNATVTQIPTKAFKLWYFYSDRPGIHFDNPLMTPQEVVDLIPQPRIIMYQ